MEADGDRDGRRGPRARSRASHSLESVLSEAVALLDEQGAAGLTFRALAARLGGGAASLYWYVSGRDELLDLAADSVFGRVLDQVADVASDDPIDDLRTTATAMFDVIAERPWLGAYVMRNTGLQVQSLRVYERIGQQVLRLGLSRRRTFHAASAVVGFVIGTAADMGQVLPEVIESGETDRDDYQSATADEWRRLDPVEFPFIHRIVEEFAEHEDRDQFRAGLDLLLEGLRLQAASGSSAE